MLHTNFEDNLFLLNCTLKNISHARGLEIDSALFRDKFFLDIKFLDRAIKKILDALMGNPHILERIEYLTSLLTVEQNYSKLLHHLVRDSEKQFDFDLDAIEAINLQHRENIKHIAEIISQSDLTEEQGMVSNLEIQLLLTESEHEEHKK